MINMRIFGLAVTTVHLVCFAAVTGASAQGRDYDIPSAKLTCLVENQKKYIDLPRALILFTPALCPLVGPEEAAYLAQNSGDDVEPLPRLLMRKRDFSCLIEKIEEHLQEADETPQADETIKFTLDCS